MGLFSRSTFKSDSSLKPKMTVTLRTERPGEIAAPISLVKKAGVDFEKKAQASVVSLQKRGVSGTRWSGVFLLDKSGSMWNEFRDGTVQLLVDRSLGWIAGVDNDGQAPFGAFGSTHEWYQDVDLSNFAGIVKREGWQADGSTNLSDSLDAALDLAKGSTDPVFLTIVTDGAPNDRARVKRQVCDMSQYPIFIKFLVVGNDPGAWAFMEELDDMTDGRLIDNVDAKRVPSPKAVSDAEFADIMTDEIDTWLAEAKRVGLVIG